jgi:uncharacterized protein (DUF983 family)
MTSLQTLTIALVIFLLLPAPAKAMIVVLAISAFAVWLAFFVEYNNNQSRWMQFIRKWL